ncbi:MAG: hypothetical protein LBE91_18360 [Tannerella sp.]|jgi:hypothetical protein|nr:hypothetical protein [Tannerella sp.]
MKKIFILGLIFSISLTTFAQSLTDRINKIDYLDDPSNVTTDPFMTVSAMEFVWENFFDDGFIKCQLITADNKAINLYQESGSMETEEVTVKTISDINSKLSNVTTLTGNKIRVHFAGKSKDFPISSLYVSELKRHFKIINNLFETRVGSTMTPGNDYDDIFEAYVEKLDEKEVKRFQSNVPKYFKQVVQTLKNW